MQVNWAYVIMHHMELHDEDNESLPYDVVLTKFFRKCKVNLSNEMPLKMFTNECEISYDIFNTKMGVVFSKFKKVITYLDKNTQTSNPKVKPYVPLPHQPIDVALSYQYVIDIVNQGFLSMNEVVTRMNLNYGSIYENNLDTLDKMWQACLQE